ncbi:uncharacterized protein BYT42DRAFT_612751 [Radiomyces spectabilis]|uniref:uncharacterized protein n=1 Tax=Radiomyces spectabilis TaxID=64574 RepID=UPI00221EA3D3|nr:uncharacterized protein BYT42DRAFT_612751 [Radiomyces spectabilis]KAI8380918.1 hypothetical protein BYT42DRAFT_612751 [Radiomyces spectabilis]
MISFTPVIFAVFAVSAVMAGPVAKAVHEKASSNLECSIDTLSNCKTTAEIANVVGITEDEVRQKQGGCPWGLCDPLFCPQNCRN